MVALKCSNYDRNQLVILLSCTGVLPTSQVAVVAWFYVVLTAPLSTFFSPKWWIYFLTFYTWEKVEEYGL